MDKVKRKTILKKKKTAKKVAKSSSKKVKLKNNSDEAEGLLTISELAEHLQITHSRITTLITRGKITVAKRVGRRKFFDLETAKKEYANSKTVVGSKKGGKGGEEPFEPKTYQGLTVADAERQEKYYKAHLAKVKYEKEKGALVEIGQVKKEAYETARKVRDALTAIPGKICHELASETDPNKIEFKLLKEINLALEELAKDE